MTNSEIYNTIAESLQCDIDTNAISYEYARIINDIAYDKFITESELPENVESILDRYISEAAGDDEEMPDTEDVTESANELDSMLEMASMVESTYENNEITNIEYNMLLESVFEKIDTYMEAFAGAGGARGKHIESQAKVLIGTLSPYFKALKDYYKREIEGNHLGDYDFINKKAKVVADIKPPSINDLVAKAKLPESVVKKNRDACNALKKFSGISGFDLEAYNIDKINRNAVNALKGRDTDEIFMIIDDNMINLKNSFNKELEYLKDYESDITTNTKAKAAFKKATGQTDKLFDPTKIKQKMHDDKLDKLKKRNAEKMANRK